MIPSATYRLQFQPHFTFRDAAKNASYFAQLGVSHIYASPIQKARMGSTHGYDIVDHSVINPALGGDSAFFEMAAAFRAQGLGIVLDIVPNHMAVGGTDNRWWLDVLEFGQASRFANHFDIDWQTDDPLLRGKILAPFLPCSYEEALGSGAIKLLYDETLQKFAFACHEHRLPLRPQDYPLVTGSAAEPSSADLSSFNSPQRLHTLLENQNFVLCWWRAADERLNWRRFFSISELAALNIDRPEVFEAVHAIPFSLYQRGLIDGVRIDHIDGLADPSGYCLTLRSRLTELASSRPRESGREAAYVVIEKILAHGESLPGAWAVDGTTGYDFMHQVSALQHEESGRAVLDALWEELSHRSSQFDDEERQARRELLDSDFSGQLDACATAFVAAADHLPQSPDLSRPLLRRTLVRLIMCLRRYRTYLASAYPGILPEDVAHAFESATRNASPDEMAALAFVRAVLAHTSGAEPVIANEAVRRLEQLSSSSAAKAVEDTAFYRYGRLLSRNDVGFDPRIFSLSPSEFHRCCARRLREFPYAMVATGTHDHKRGEDARARLAVLSEISTEWAIEVQAWFALTEQFRDPEIDDGAVYQLFQTLLGAWPTGLRIDDSPALRTFADRIEAWELKALREAKLHTSWTAINQRYEQALLGFLRAIVDPDRATPFLDRLATFVDRIAAAGAANSLVQTALRCMTPGVPDTYQGSELWDLSLVDPDNRRVVDFETRSRSLLRRSESIDPFEPPQSRQDGQIKLALLATLLNARKREPSLFLKGAYEPLVVEGSRSRHVLAFARRHDDKFMVVAVALHVAPTLAGHCRIAPPSDWWGDTTINLEELPACPARDFLRSGQSSALPARALASRWLASLPVALFGTF